MNLEIAKARSNTFLKLLKFGGLLPLGLVVLTVFSTRFIADSDMDFMLRYLVVPALLHIAAAVVGWLIGNRAGVRKITTRALLLLALALSFFLAPFYSFWSLAIAFPFLVSISLLTLWLAALIAALAVDKGRDWTTFFVLALFFPIITWIIVAVVNTDQAVPVSAMKTCPRCAELVKAEATLCKHCGSEIG
jgi:hypothetical protein